MHSQHVRCNTRANPTTPSTFDSADPIQLFHAALLGICRVSHARRALAASTDGAKKMHTKKEEEERDAMSDRKNSAVRTLMLCLMAGISPGDCRKRTKYSGKKQIPTFIGIRISSKNKNINLTSLRTQSIKRSQALMQK